MQLQFLWIFLNQEILSKCADIKGAIEKKWRPSTCGNKSRATVTCHHEEKLLIVKKTRPKMTETSQKRGNLLPYSTKFLGLRIPTTIPNQNFSGAPFYFFLIWRVFRSADSNLGQPCFSRRLADDFVMPLSKSRACRQFLRFSCRDSWQKQTRTATIIIIQQWFWK